METVRVAFDVGSLRTTRTGVGHAVASLRTALKIVPDVHLEEYVLSFRSRRIDGVRRLPMPALLAHRLWGRFGRPHADRMLGHPQVIHGTNYVVPPARVPRVVSVYDCWFLRNPQSAGADVRRAGIALRRAVADGAVVHVSSQATADAVHELLPGATVAVIALGSLPVPAAPDTPPIAELGGRPYIVSVGTIERRKNLATLVDAFGLMANDHPELALVLAGSDGDDRPAVDSAVDRLGPELAARVLFTGRVEASTRAWLLRHAQVLAYPSLDEGFGFPLLDAMQVGVPVVASDAGSIPEVAGAAALFGAPHDSAKMAANLSVAVGDEEVRHTLTAAGETQWRSFSWDRCASELAGLYHRLADGYDHPAGSTSAAASVRSQ
ncbi:MAG: glycosyltransferase family 1 protein [Ilumatobacteraceae bacterium]